MQQMAGYYQAQDHRYKSEGNYILNQTRQSLGFLGLGLGDLLVILTSIFHASVGDHITFYPSKSKTLTLESPIVVHFF